MGRYILKRMVEILVLFLAVSVLVFVLIQLPPGDFLSTRIEMMRMEGTPMNQSEIDAYTRQYHLDQPVFTQYFYWVRGIVLHGDFGYSFNYDMPVKDVIGSRMLMTIVLSLLTLVFTWIVAFPVGILCAMKQYSWVDYLFSLLGFLGVSIPGFLLALVLMYTIFKTHGVLLSGLFSMEYVDAPWSLAKFQDMLKHVWLPMVIIGVHGTASSIRVIRGQMLDELSKQYLTAAKARGVSGFHLLMRYPVRVAINPMVSTVGWQLPNIFSGESVVSIVLNLQTMGPVLLTALKSQDMYLAGTILLLTSFLSLVGTLISDILLALLDPRIRMEGGRSE